MAIRLSTGCANALAGNTSTGDASLRDIFHAGVIAVYTGAQPATADAAESGTLLGYITVASGEFTPGSETNGLVWDSAVAGVCPKPSATEWSITPIADGTAGWARLYDNSMITGASSTARRIDMACGIGAGELRWTTTAFTTGVKFTIETLNLGISLT
jgi:hypothetical protein